jgi:hypothetical protein
MALDMMILMRANPLQGPKENVGPENGGFFHPSVSLDAISGPKKSRFSGPRPSNGPVNGFAPIKEGGEQYKVYLFLTTRPPPPPPFISIQPLYRTIYKSKAIYKVYKIRLR